MSNTEIAISAVGLLLGYWLVSYLLSASKRGDDKLPGPTNHTHETTAPWHQVLQVAADASVEDIRAAYQREREQYHPDKVQGLGPEFHVMAQRKSAELEAAYRAAMHERGVPL